MAQARELMDRVTAAIFDQDFDAVRSCYTPDVVFTTPDLGTQHGVDNLVDWLREFTVAMPDMTYAMSRKLEDGGCAIDDGTVSGTNTGPLAMPDGSSLPPTGKKVRLRALDIVTVEGGLISKHDFYYDQFELLSQLGLMEAPTATV